MQHLKTIAQDMRGCVVLLIAACVCFPASADVIQLFDVDGLPLIYQENGEWSATYDTLTMSSSDVYSRARVSGGALTYWASEGPTSMWYAGLRLSLDQDIGGDYEASIKVDNFLVTGLHGGTCFSYVWLRHGELDFIVFKGNLEKVQLRWGNNANTIRSVTRTTPDDFVLSLRRVGNITEAWLGDELFASTERDASTADVGLIVERRGSPDMTISFDEVSVVPEPATLFLLALGALGVLGRGRRGRRKAVRGARRPQAKGDRT